jgi:hypothetical protein
MPTANERFEIIGNLYYARHHRLRPGKSEATETHRDSGSEENHQMFDNWIATHSFTDAIDRIIELEARVKATEDKYDGT